MTTVTLGRVIRSEWIKLTALRSALLSYVSIAFALSLVAGIALTLPGSTDDDCRDALLTLVIFVELLVGITGVVAAAGEYSAGTIRSTLAAVPERRPVLAAKALVHGGLVLGLMAPAVAVALAAGLVLAPEEIGSPADGEALRGIVGSALVFALTCALGVALGTLTRSTPAAIGILFCLMFLPVMVTVVPEVTAFLPGRAAQAVIGEGNPEAELLGGGVAAATLVAWATGALTAAAAALRRRDA